MIFFVFNGIYPVIFLFISTVNFWLGTSFATFFWSFLKPESRKVLQRQFEREKHVCSCNLHVAYKGRAKKNRALGSVVNQRPAGHGSFEDGTPTLDPCNLASISSIAIRAKHPSLWGELLCGFRIGRGAVGHKRLYAIIFNHCSMCVYIYVYIYSYADSKS